MATVNYQMLDGKFLVTDFNDSDNVNLIMHFEGIKDASLVLARKCYEVKNGMATVRKSFIENGIHTPILRTAQASTVCDRLKAEGGRVTPEISISERTFLLTRLLSSMQRDAEAREKDISELSLAVYGKSIL